MTHFQAVSRIMHLEEIIQDVNCPECCKVQLLIEWLELRDVFMTLPSVINTSH